jgi:ribosomal protein L37AE/L43A
MTKRRGDRMETTMIEKNPASMKCPDCKKEMLASTPSGVFYCQSENCKIAYIILRDTKVKVVDL